jgi:hypothetical protein
MCGVTIHGFQIIKICAEEPEDSTYSILQWYNIGLRLIGESARSQPARKAMLHATEALHAFYVTCNTSTLGGIFRQVVSFDFSVGGHAIGCHTADAMFAQNLTQATSGSRNVACGMEILQHFRCMQHLFYSNPHPSYILP